MIVPRNPNEVNQPSPRPPWRSRALLCAVAGLSVVGGFVLTLAIGAPPDQSAVHAVYVAAHLVAAELIKEALRQG